MASQQEIENFKSQLAYTRNTIADLDTKLTENKQVDATLMSLLNTVKDKADNELDRYKAQAEEVYQKNVNAKITFEKALILILLLFYKKIKAELLK